MTTRKRKSLVHKRVLDARPDTLDFRDRLYVPSLIEVPSHRPLSDYLKAKVPVLDQGMEGACTGFGLASVAHYLLRTRKVSADTTAVSPWMFYAMARRYDEWPGDDYSGSSARGAMKAWHKHGVCRATLWPGTSDARAAALSRNRAVDALGRPLGAYFRVNHKDLVAMHAALAEAGILYGTAIVHDGWDKPDSDGVIASGSRELGGHAFAIVAFDQDGFWIQNSWGRSWGLGGFGHLRYEDWLTHGTDVWVARLGVPVRLQTVDPATTRTISGASRIAPPDIRPHVISIGNDGRPGESGPYGNTAADIVSIFSNDFPRITAGWARKRILLYAHGGLVGEKAALERAHEYAQTLLAQEIYLIAFIWKTDFWTTLTNVLRDALSRRRPEGVLDSTKDFMLDRLDDALEPLARSLSGLLLWNEMKENALLSTTSVNGGARLVAGHVAHLKKTDPAVEIHIAAHSAGSIFLAPVVGLLTSNGKVKSGLQLGSPGFGIRINTCTLWAPACTIDLFSATYAPAAEAGYISRLSLFNLRDQIERDDHCGHIYNKSLLYLVANAFESRLRIPLFRDGVPLLGLDKFVRRDAGIQQLIAQKKMEIILAPNEYPAGGENGSGARQHGAFDDDDATVRAMIARVLGTASALEPIQFQRSAAALRESRLRLIPS